MLEFIANSACWKARDKGDTETDGYKSLEDLPGQAQAPAFGDAVVSAVAASRAKQLPRQKSGGSGAASRAHLAGAGRGRT